MFGHSLGVRDLHPMPGGPYSVYTLCPQEGPGSQSHRVDMMALRAKGTERREKKIKEGGEPCTAGGLRIHRSFHSTFIVGLSGSPTTNRGRTSRTTDTRNVVSPNRITSR